MVLGYLGGLCATLPFERAAHYFGWRASLLAAGALCAGIVIFLAVLLKKTGKISRKNNGFSARVVWKIIRNKSSVPVIISWSIIFSLYFLFQAIFGKKFLQDVYRLDSRVAAGYTFVMMLVAIACFFFSGYFSRVIGRRKPIMVCSAGLAFLAMLVLVLALTCRFGSGWLLFGYILLAVSSGSSPVCVTSMKELNSAEAAATSVGLLNGSCYLSVSLLANLAGFGLDRFRAAAVRTGQAVIYPPQAYMAIFVCCLALAAVSLTASFFIRESYEK